MNCLICKTGTTQQGTTTVTLERDTTVIVIKDVPAQVCDNCGEYYLSEEVSSRIYALAEEAVKRKVEVEVLHYAA
jgi:YgiT-type zinc finger domain-containing protein